MGAAGAVAILGKGRADPELLENYRTAFENPYRAAERGLVDAVIDPVDTRRVLCDALEILVNKRDAQPARRHSNTPL
jgi:propionyl-CoA carboxylase beta chain